MTPPYTPSSPACRIAIVGGAGFIGSHFTDHFLSNPTTVRVTLYDNFSSGREWHYGHHSGDNRLQVVRGDAGDLPLLTQTLAGHDLVIHLASNPDIARASVEPSIDFTQGTQLTNNVVEAMRVAGVGRILYASGSGVYGDLGSVEVTEDHSPLHPISTYGASKLAGEALICSYCHMFGMVGRAFRFGNVVGPRQTHGVGFDFIRRLRQNPERLDILGDGRQSKSYIHVQDVVHAVMMAEERCADRFQTFNVATGDYVTVTEIAEIAIEVLALNARPQIAYSGGDRGWKGDVPIIRLNTDRIKALGWRCGMSTREAMRKALAALIFDQDDSET